MVFGRKKKQEEEEVAEGSTLNQDKDLAVGYGNADELNDDLSAADSIPPPPPTGDVIETNGDVIETKNENLSQDDSRTLEESPSVGANDDLNDSIDEKKEKEMIKRKKLLLIAGCVVSFFILLGLAIKYGQTRSQAALTSGLESGLEDVESVEPPTTNSTDLDPGTLPPVSPTPENDVVEEAPQDIDTTGDITEVNKATPAPSVNGTAANSNLASSGPSALFADCVANEISVLSSCENGIGSASMNFCLIDDLSDQFWAWIRTPPRTPQIVSNNWGWMRAGAGAEIGFLAEGNYEVGLFSNGREILEQYPLISSTEFTINCRQ